MKWREIETKYRVTDMKLRDFTEVAKSLNPTSYVEAAGYDYYYTKGEDEFIRYREGSLHQLTIKKKTLDKNNFVRTEINLDIRPKDKATVEAFCQALGYKPNFCIYKACFIYYYENCDIVYYVIYDEDMKESDRFLEIEMLEDYAWESEEQAWDALLKVEQTMKPLGVSPQARIKKSLFEMYRRDK